MTKFHTLSFATLASATLALVGFGGAAQAAVVYNTSLANPPGVYFGNGNSNSGFAVSTTGSVELGLSAITRFVGPIVPALNTYDVPTGATGVAGKTGSAWGFVFSVDLNADGKGTQNLSTITTRLTLNDVGLGTSGFFDPLAIPDNAEFGAGGVCSPAFLCGASSGFYAFQNSEALSFAAVAGALGDPGYNVNANDTYIFTLQAFNSNAALLGSDTITVVAGKGATRIPEPVTLSLFGAGFAGIAALRRRRKSSQA
jgi:hypothetical protein